MFIEQRGMNEQSLWNGPQFVHLLIKGKKQKKPVLLLFLIILKVSSWEALPFSLNEKQALYPPVLSVKGSQAA